MFRTISTILHKRNRKVAQVVLERREAALERVRQHNEQTVLGAAESQGFDPDGDAVRLAMLRASCVTTYLDHSQAAAWFETQQGTYVSCRMQDNKPSIMIHAMAHENGGDMVARLVTSWVGSLDFTATIRIEAYSTTFLDSDGHPRLAFFGAGRKTHGNDCFRVHNTIHALSLVGIDATVEQIAIQSGQQPSVPLEFTRRVDGSWTNRQLEVAHS